MADSSPYKLILLEETTEDMLSLFSYYESKRTGLGDVFLDSLGNCLHRIENRPQSWQYARTAQENIRRGLIDKPAGVVLYIFDDPYIRVLSIKDIRSDWR